MFSVKNINVFEKYFFTNSASDAGLVKRAKELLSHHGFGSDPTKGISTDYNRPLLIPAW
jgi:hypothetical protein